jgi:putative glycosyltransferase (TIGR04348 family)
MLAGMGHSARVATGTVHGGYDVLVALHALKSAEAVRRSREVHPDRPVVVALTGTDLYRDIRTSREAQRSLELADRLVVLHDRAIEAVPRAYRDKTRVIRQSAERAPGGRPRRTDSFEVALVAHLRPEKDPLRAAMAARMLAASSRIRIVHAGRSLSGELAVQARREAASNPRFTWLGEVAPARARRLIATSQLLVLTSILEGGANVLGEAIVSGTPVVSTRIPAAVSALGSDYAGFFRVGDTRGLARLLARAERDPRFLQRLAAQTRARRHLFSPSLERDAWRSLLRELGATQTT